jgi:hypothetical protein
MRRLILLLVFLLALPSIASGQGGTVHGIVTDRRGHPLPGTIVEVKVGDGARHVALADSLGRYRVDGIPAGKGWVRAARIGMITDSARIVVNDGRDLEMKLVLRYDPHAVLVDEFPVAPASLYASVPGSSRGKIRPDPEGMAGTFSQLLDARAAGVVVRASSGTVGAGSRIRIRGASSFFLANEPLVVIDGVRTITDPRALRIDVGGQTPSSIDDLRPDEVESVNVLRGPAAAAAYGPAGAAGVLEVTTVRGPPRRQSPEWRAWARTGVREAPNGGPADYDQAGTTLAGTRATQCTLRARAAGECVPVDALESFSPLSANSPFRTGTTRAVGGSVRGAGRFLAYSLSAEGARDVGVSRESAGAGSSFRGNVSAYLGAGLDVRLGLAHSQRDLRLPFEGNSPLQVAGAGLTGAARDDPRQGYRDGPGPDIDPYESSQRSRRAQGVLAATWTPLSWLRLEGIFGVDRRDADDRQVVATTEPPGGRAPLRHAGSGRELRDGQLRASTGWDLGSLWMSTEIGWQRLTDRATLDDSMAVAGLGGSRSIVHQLARGHALTLKQEIGWKAVNAAAVLRRDAPGAGAAVMSGSLGAEWNFARVLKLRAAYGSTARTFAPLPGIGSPADVCAAAPCVGTDQPERLREIEGGADISLRSGEITLSLTGYRKTATGLLLAGLADDGSLRLRNGGAVSNTGAEMALRATVLRGGNVGWSAELLSSVNRNRVTELDAARDRLTFPSRMLALGSRLTLWNQVTLYARAEYQAGSSVPDDIHVTPYDRATSRGERVAVASSQLGTRAAYVEGTGFVKLREVGISVAAPREWAWAFGASGVSLTLAGRNVATVTGYGGMDPETRSFGQAPVGTPDVAQMPLPRTWITRIDVRF